MEVKTFDVPLFISGTIAVYPSHPDGVGPKVEITCHGGRVLKEPKQRS